MPWPERISAGSSTRWRPAFSKRAEGTAHVSERGTEVRARLATMKELEEVPGAMRGMAAARIQEGERAQLAAQEYARRIGAALASLSQEDLPPDPFPSVEPTIPTLI